MKTQIPESLLRAAIAAHQRQHAARQTRIGLILMTVAVLVLFILPRQVPTPYGALVGSLGGALLMTIYLGLLPETLRSRTGSMTPAYCLVGALWLGAATVSMLTLFG